jgi:hypothetical protein
MVPFRWDEHEAAGDRFRPEGCRSFPEVRGQRFGPPLDPRRKCRAKNAPLRGGRSTATRENGGPHSAEPSIADQDEAAGSSPARPMTVGLTWANARPLSLSIAPLPCLAYASRSENASLECCPRNAGRTRRCTGEGEPRRRRGHRWSTPSRWAMAAASPRPATPNGRGCGGRERWRLLGDRGRLPDRHVLDLLPSGGCRAALAVGQGSRSTPTVRPYRRRRFATTTRE